MVFYRDKGKKSSLVLKMGYKKERLVGPENNNNKRENGNQVRELNVLDAWTARPTFSCELVQHI